MLLSSRVLRFGSSSREVLSTCRGTCMWMVNEQCYRAIENKQLCNDGWHAGFGPLRFPKNKMDCYELNPVVRMTKVLNNTASHHHFAIFYTVLCKKKSFCTTNTSLQQFQCPKVDVTILYTFYYHCDFTQTGIIPLHFTQIKLGGKEHMCLAWYLDY